MDGGAEKEGRCHLQFVRFSKNIQKISNQTKLANRSYSKSTIATIPLALLGWRCFGETNEVGVVIKQAWVIRHHPTSTRNRGRGRREHSRRSMTGPSHRSSFTDNVLERARFTRGADGIGRGGAVRSKHRPDRTHGARRAEVLRWLGLELARGAVRAHRIRGPGTRVQNVPSSWADSTVCARGLHGGTLKLVRRALAT